jgi:hypothetical protein
MGLVPATTVAAAGAGLIITLMTESGTFARSHMKQSDCAKPFEAMVARFF